MTLKRYFHFTLGPVQDFVAQARRTRDFWAGSFILSWLSAIAMLVVEKQDGKITFPKPDDGFRKALEGSGGGPKQGNVPNRFKAEVNESFDPRKVEKTVRDAWRELAEHVWKNNLEEYAMDKPKTREIWDRQIKGFWDIQWAVVDDVNNSNTLDCLKNWRTHLPPDEAGVKCMMMDGWQELSGAKRPGQEPAEFWKGLRNRGKSGMASDLREGEMLCAIAFVKRRFARCFGTKFSVELHSGWNLKGWSLPPGVPSVHYIAAAPWLAKLLEATKANALEDQMWAFHDAAYRLCGEYGEWDSNIRCIQKVDGAKKWKALDGAVLFDSMLENPRLWAKAGEAKDVLRRLKCLRAETELEPVSPFYAVLLMDGDELGIHMSDSNKQQKITDGLAEFTAKVTEIVERHNGFLVYAGGDDVLALLPLEFALPCAAALRNYYLECFRGTDIPTTLSGAIEYAHIKMPLGKVLGDAHQMLDDVAKDGRGRDAIACRIWKPGGLVVEWAMPWEHALQDGMVVIDSLARTFRNDMRGEGAEMASGFFYRIRERFELLNPVEHHHDAVLDENLALDLLATEYLNSGLVQDKKIGMPEARERIKPLLDQCRPVMRDKTVEGNVNWKKSSRLEADAALMVRFLACKGVER